MKQELLYNIRLIGGVKKVINSVDLFAIHRSIYLREQFVFLTDGSTVNISSIASTEPHYNNYPGIACGQQYEPDAVDLARIPDTHKQAHKQAMQHTTQFAQQDSTNTHTVPMTLEDLRKGDIKPWITSGTGDDVVFIDQNSTADTRTQEEDTTTAHDRYGDTGLTESQLQLEREHGYHYGEKSVRTYGHWTKDPTRITQQTQDAFTRQHQQDGEMYERRIRYKNGTQTQEDDRYGDPSQVKTTGQTRRPPSKEVQGYIDEIKEKWNKEQV